MVVWSGKGWEHGAIQIKGTDVVVDWTASQLQEDPDKAREYDFPSIRPRAEADAQWGPWYIWNFEDPFFKGMLLREKMLPWEQARQPIPHVDSEPAQPAQAAENLPET